jgi:hypothetical protein
MENVEFTGASGTVYSFNFGTNAACRLEEAIDRSYDDAMLELKGQSPRVSLVRQWVKAALVTPDPVTITNEQVGDLIDDIGGWTFVLVGLGSQSPIAVETSATIQHALSAMAAVKSQDTPETPEMPPEPITH